MTTKKSVNNPENSIKEWLQSPKLPKEKTEESIFHVMVRSIKEVTLFREDKDKEMYMNILRGYQ